MDFVGILFDYVWINRIIGNLGVRPHFLVRLSPFAFQALERERRKLTSSMQTTSDQSGLL